MSVREHKVIARFSIITYHRELRSNWRSEIMSIDIADGRCWSLNFAYSVIDNTKVRLVGRLDLDIETSSQLNKDGLDLEPKWEEGDSSSQGLQ